MARTRDRRPRATGTETRRSASGSPLFSALSFVILMGCVQGPERPIQSVGLTRLGGSLEILAQARGEETGAPGDTRKTEEFWLEESLHALTEGYVYHPNLLAFSLGAGFGLVQRDYSQVQAGENDGSDRLGYLNEFDLQGVVLGKKNYPFTFFARRDEGLVSRLFRSSLQATNESYGAIWNIFARDATVNLQFNHQNTRLDALSGTEPDQEQTSTQLKANVTLSLARQDDLRIEFEHRTFEEDLTDLDFDYDRILVRHTYEFGEDDEHSLDSSITYLEQSGTFESQDSRWREQLRLDLDESLDFGLGFELRSLARGTRLDVPDVETDSIELTSYLTHQLYRSLTTTLSGYARFIELAPSGEEDELGLRLALNYRKDTGVGTLSAGVSGEIRSDDRRNVGSQLVEVLDEVHTFQDPDPVNLNNDNIVASTIFVTAPDGVTVFLAGIDYQIVPIGQSLQIERIIGGALQNGSTIFVDYLYDAGGSYRLSTNILSATVRHDFDFGLGVYYRYVRLDQSVDIASGPAPTFEDSITHAVGLDYDRPWIRAFAEYEDRDSNINAFDRIRLGADLRHEFDWGGRATAGASWTRRRERFPRERTSELYLIRAGYRQRLDDTFNAQIQATWRLGSDDVRGDDDGIDVELRINWVVNQLEMALSGRYTDYESPFSVAESWLLLLQLTRRF